MTTREREREERRETERDRERDREKDRVCARASVYKGVPATFACVGMAE